MHKCPCSFLSNEKAKCVKSECLCKPKLYNIRLPYVIWFNFITHCTFGKLVMDWQIRTIMFISRAAIWSFEFLSNYKVIFWQILSKKKHFDLLMSDKRTYKFNEASLINYVLCQGKPYQFCYYVLITFIFLIWLNSHLGIHI